MATDSRNVCQFERRPVKQVLHSLLNDQSRIEISATGKSISPKDEEMHTRRLKLVKDTLTVGTYRV